MTDIAWNTAYRPQARALPREMQLFHEAQPFYQCSPLNRFELRHPLGTTQLWVKDERHRFGLPAFKVLGASYAIYRALCEKGMPASHQSCEDMANWLKGDRLRLITATDGNHGRAVAFVARQLGVSAIVVVPKGTAIQRIQAIKSEGAAVIQCKAGYDQAVKHAEALVNDENSWLIQDTAWDGYHQIPDWITEGYLTMLWESERQLAGIVPSVIFIQVGVGSLAAAVCRFVSNRWPTCHVIGVEPVTAACGLASIIKGELQSVRADGYTVMAGLNCGSLSERAWPELSSGLKASMVVPEESVKNAAECMAALGMEIGASGLAGVAGLHVAVDRQVEFSKMGVDLRCAFVIATEAVTDELEFSS